MIATDDLSARLTVLETVVRQLVTHMAVRDDDPRGWVRTRKVLAMRAMDNDDRPTAERLDTLRDAITGFFEPVEAVTVDYGDDATPAAPPR